MGLPGLEGFPGIKVSARLSVCSPVQHSKMFTESLTIGPGAVLGWGYLREQNRQKSLSL